LAIYPHIQNAKRKFFEKKIRKANCFFILFLMLENSLFAVLNYSMVVSTPGFTPLGPTKTVLANFNWACGDQMVSAPINLGFTFTFDGVGYTQFEVSDNGEVFLGAPAISCNSNCGPACIFPNGIEPNNLATGVNRPAICPLWNDLAFNSAGSALNYLMTGSAPNRVMTIEWLLMDWKYNNTNLPHGGISFQVKLWESPSGQIDFIYRQDAQALGVLVQAPSANIGLMGVMGDYYSTNNTGSAISKVTQTSITVKPVNGVQYRWTNLAALPVGLVSFEGKYSENKTVLEWKTATESNNDYFTIQRSVDAFKFENIGTVKGSGNNTGYKTYAYTDFPPSKENTIFYYRLQQTDLDQKISYSEIIQVNTNSARDKPPEIYFDNESGQLIITAEQIPDEGLVIDIIDQLGQPVFHKNLDFTNGNNKIFVPIPVSLPGIYFARFSGKGGSFVSQSKFIKY
jgi:hypothetical protein